MSTDCCHDAGDPHRGNESYRRVLWTALAINAVMFAVEVVAGFAAGSASLQADALDFLGDAANYAISLFVVGTTLRYRASAAPNEGSDDGGPWLVGHRYHDLARMAWKAARGLHHGGGRHGRAAR